MASPLFSPRGHLSAHPRETDLEYPPRSPSLAQVFQFPSLSKLGGANLIDVSFFRPLWEKMCVSSTEFNQDGRVQIADFYQSQELDNHLSLSLKFYPEQIQCDRLCQLWWNFRFYELGWIVGARGRRNQMTELVW
jgi:hypothetical protein